jgi:hypothetical protein
MRNGLALLWAVCACGGVVGGPGHTDAAVDGAVDAATVVDASPDAPLPPDPPLVTVTSACTNLCNKLASCLGTTDPDALQGCIDNCETDLVDCSFDEVTDVDMCSQATCTGDDPTQWELTTCITAIPCVDTPISGSGNPG